MAVKQADLAFVTSAFEGVLTLTRTVSVVVADGGDDDDNNNNNNTGDVVRTGTSTTTRTTTVSSEQPPRTTVAGMQMLTSRLRFRLLRAAGLRPNIDLSYVVASLMSTCGAKDLLRLNPFLPENKYKNPNPEPLTL